MEVSPKRQQLAEKLSDRTKGLILQKQTAVDVGKLGSEQDRIAPDEYRRRREELSRREVFARRLIGEADTAAKALCRNAPSVVVTEFRRLEQRGIDAIHRSFDWRREAEAATPETDRARLREEADREQEAGVRLYQAAVDVLAALKIEPAWA